MSYHGSPANPPPGLTSPSPPVREHTVVSPRGQPARFNPSSLRDVHSHPDSYLLAMTNTGTSAQGVKAILDRELREGRLEAGQECFC